MYVYILCKKFSQILSHLSIHIRPLLTCTRWLHGTHSMTFKLPNKLFTPCDFDKLWIYDMGNPIP